MQYEQTKNKIKYIYNQTSENSNNLDNVQTKELKEDEKIDFKTINIAKQNILIETDWYNWIYNDTVAASQIITLNMLHFPLFLLPYVKVACQYKSGDDTQAPSLYDTFNVYYRVLEYDEDEDLKNQISTLRIVIYIKTVADISHVKFLIGITNPRNFV